MWELLANAGLMTFWDPISKGLGNVYNGAVKAGGSVTKNVNDAIQNTFFGNFNTNGYDETAFLPIGKNPADTATPSIADQKKMIREYQASHPTKTTTSKNTTKTINIAGFNLTPIELLLGGFLLILLLK